MLHYNSRCVYNPLIYYYNAFITANQSVLTTSVMYCAVLCCAVLCYVLPIIIFPLLSVEAVKRHHCLGQRTASARIFSLPRLTVERERQRVRLSCVALLLLALIWLEEPVDLGSGRLSAVLLSCAALSPQAYTQLGFSVQHGRQSRTRLSGTIPQPKRGIQPG